MVNWKVKADIKERKKKVRFRFVRFSVLYFVWLDFIYWKKKKSKKEQNKESNPRATKTRPLLRKAGWVQWQQWLYTCVTNLDSKPNSIPFPSLHPPQETPNQRQTKQCLFKLTQRERGRAAECVCEKTEREIHLPLLSLLLGFPFWDFQIFISFLAALSLSFSSPPFLIRTKPKFGGHPIFSIFNK